jgi:hypothetical protein
MTFGEDICDAFSGETLFSIEDWESPVSVMERALLMR